MLKFVTGWTLELFMEVPAILSRPIQGIWAWHTGMLAPLSIQMLEQGMLFFLSPNYLELLVLAFCKKLLELLCS